MSYVEIKINRNLHLLTRHNYPWLENIPTVWPLIIEFLECQTPTIGCNIDKVAKGNHGLNIGIFCIKMMKEI